MITYNFDLLHLPLLSLSHNQFNLKHKNPTDAILKSNTAPQSLELINHHFNTHFAHSTDTKRPSSPTRYAYANKNFKHHENRTNSEADQYRTFVQQIITSDPFHLGYIFSCLPGDYNKNLLFFNIAGNYRSCPRKGVHHRRNSVAIIVDTRNHSYTIRCKDIDCNNTKLTWNPIE